MRPVGRPTRNGYAVNRRTVRDRDEGNHASALSPANVSQHLGMTYRRRERATPCAAVWVVALTIRACGYVVRRPGQR